MDFLFILINSNILQKDWFKCWRGPAESQWKHFYTAMISNMQLFPFIALNPFNFCFHNFLLNTLEDFMLKLRLSKSLCALHRSLVFFSFANFCNICSHDTIFLHKERLKTVNTSGPESESSAILLYSLCIQCITAAIWTLGVYHSGVIIILFPSFCLVFNPHFFLPF